MATVEDLRAALDKLGQELREQRTMLVSTSRDYVQASIRILQIYDLPALQGKHPHAIDARFGTVGAHFKLDRMVECIDNALRFIDQYLTEI